MNVQVVLIRGLVTVVVTTIAAAIAAVVMVIRRRSRARYCADGRSRHQWRAQNCRRTNADSAAGKRSRSRVMAIRATALTISFVFIGKHPFRVSVIATTPTAPKRSALLCRSEK